MNNDKSNNDNGIDAPNVSDSFSEENENEFANWANDNKSVISDDIVFEDESIDDNNNALLFQNVYRKTSMEEMIMLLSFW